MLTLTCWSLLCALPTGSHDDVLTDAVLSSASLGLRIWFTAAPWEIKRGMPKGLARWGWMETFLNVSNETIGPSWGTHLTAGAKQTELGVHNFPLHSFQMIKGSRPCFTNSGMRTIWIISGKFYQITSIKNTK